MRRAMYDAEVGDDVLGDDPTVKRLETLAAERVGKEAALFVPSGTMANLISVLVHCRRGEEMILGDQAHIYIYEAGGSAAVGSVHPRSIPNQPNGRLDLAQVEAAIRDENIHTPRTRLLALENTHNRCSGAVLPLSYMQAAGELTRRRGLKLHLDGARLFNAAAALSVPAAELAAPCDSVSCCLSKGLGAPVGSLIAGSHEFIYEARRQRKVLGGGMRQSGVLAAAGIVALTQMTERLTEDHRRARRLAEGLAELPGIILDPQDVATNIVIFALEREDITPAELVARLAEQGVWILSMGGKRLRAVTNYHIDDAALEQAIGVFREILA